MSGDWNIETGDGGVVLSLPDEVSARLDVQTGEGRITLSGFPDMPIEREGDGRRLQAVLGTGEGNLGIRTSDGNIALKRSYVPVPSCASPRPPRPRQRRRLQRRHDTNKGRGTGNKSEGRQGTSHQDK